MSNALVQISEEERERMILELDIACFLHSIFEEGQELSIIVYNDEERKDPQRINIKKNFDYTVENNRIKIYNKDEEESAFELDYSNYDFVFWDEYLKFDHNEEFITIKLSPALAITEEEDALCIQ